MSLSVQQNEPSIGLGLKKKNGTVNEIKNEMMDVRWKTFQFFHQMAKKDVTDAFPRSKCFVDLAMNN